MFKAQKKMQRRRSLRPRGTTEAGMSRPMALALGTGISIASVAAVDGLNSTAQHRLIPAVKEANPGPVLLASSKPKPTLVGGVVIRFSGNALDTSYGLFYGPQTHEVSLSFVPSFADIEQDGCKYSLTHFVGTVAIEGRVTPPGSRGSPEYRPPPVISESGKKIPGEAVPEFVPNSAGPGLWKFPNVRLSPTESWSRMVRRALFEQIKVTYFATAYFRCPTRHEPITRETVFRADQGFRHDNGPSFGLR